MRAKLFTLHPPSTPLTFHYAILTHLTHFFPSYYRKKDPQATVKAHIKLLHDYNEIRDVGQGLMGIIADTKGVRVRDVYQDFGVGEGD